MKLFRSHITRFASTFLLIAGIIAYFINPADDEVQHEAFTSWLQSNLKTQDDSAVLNQINELSSLDEELEDVIRKASKLVQSNTGLFSLPVDEASSDEKDIYQVLLSEWNAFQHSTTGMGKAVIITNAKPHSTLPVDGYSFSGKAISPQQIPIPFSENELLVEVIASADYHISPLSGGIAIGAP